LNEALLDVRSTHESLRPFAAKEPGEKGIGGAGVRGAPRVFQTVGIPRQPEDVPVPIQVLLALRAIQRHRVFEGKFRAVTVA
jgi:hypothetical protein